MAIQMSSLGFSPLLPAIRKELAASYSRARAAEPVAI
jgi:hypothetical protein